MLMTRRASMNLQQIIRNVVEYTYSYESGDKLSAEIHNTLDNLSYFPRIGVIGSVENTRECFCRGYRIIYRETENQVQILAIIHCRQQYPTDYYRSAFKA
ncbi:plasmid stabilization system protein [Mannheimia haemolytica M42548]|nr:plasmid stabilization system protein [Mannheimia haemolytica M42548]